MTLNLSLASPLSTHPLFPSDRTVNQSLTHTTHNTMASKRKSTVPCMIPSKSKHMREEIILGCLPDLLPTIPEDSILSISGDGSGHSQHTSPKPPDINRGQKGGTYSCSNCRFESRDLNFFLDHMHNCHIDFRAQPTFYCLNCGVSVVRFEALALHNAKAHKGIMQGSITASLHVNKRDGLTTVEQSLFTDGGEDYRESGLSLTKTPIAKMMKAKGEHKKIVVSHTVEVRKIDTGKDVDLNMLTNVPELQNGALSVSGAPAMPRTTVTHVITPTTSNQVFHQQTPPLYSSHSSNSFKDLPKVMIPLSSIPTYDAAMDTSSFLKTSFGKFPYPTKAELCYLTVVSEFPEEQIKLWFTAQRLKQGISWSPEEIEEARRKMFSTVFQGQPQQRQPVVPQHASHLITHRTVTSQPAHFGPVGPHYPIPNIPFGSLRNRTTGVITTQANMSTNPKVVRVTYSAPAYPPKFPSVVRTTQVLTKNTHLPTLEPAKSNGLDMAGVNSVNSTSNSRSSSSSSCSSSSSISSYSSCSNGGETGNRKHVNGHSPTNGMATGSIHISNNEEHGSHGKAHGNMNSVPMDVDGGATTKSKVIVNNTSITDSTCNTHNNNNNNNNTIVQNEQSRVTKPNDDCNNYTNQHTKNGSISSDCPSAAASDGVPSLPNRASISPNESTSTTVITKSCSSSSLPPPEEAAFTKDFPVKGMSILQQLIKDDTPEQDVRCPELKVDPIKINLKKLKMNEPEPKSDLDIFAPLTMNPETFDSPLAQLPFPSPWGTMTPHQVHILRQVFCGTPWPSSQQYEDLSIMTGLPKSEVVRWFSDSRYIHKNSQRKWLESFQRLPAESEEAHTRGDVNGELSMDPLMARRKPMERAPNMHHEGGGGGGGGAGMNLCQREAWQDTYSPLLGLMGSGEAGERGRPGTSAQSGVLQDPWLDRVKDHQQPMANQSFMEQQADASQARDRLRMELLEV